MKKAAGVLAAVVITFSACSHLSHATFVRDDATIRDEVQNNLRADGFEAIGVKVDRGVVTLTGQLTTATFREKAASDAERVDSVKRVINSIEVAQ